MRSITKKFSNLAHMPEVILIQQAKWGNKDAFGKLYEMYLGKIYRYIFFQVGQNVHIAEDITEIVFIKAWEGLEKYKIGSFQAWLYQIARNAVIDHYREHSRTTVLEDHVIDDKQDHEHEVFLGMEMDRVRAAMKHLTEEQQELITLKFVDELSNKEIAKLLGKKEDAIRAMQYRALQALRDYLQ